MTRVTRTHGLVRKDSCPKDDLNKVFSILRKGHRMEITEPNSPKVVFGVLSDEVSRLSYRDLFPCCDLCLGETFF